VALGDRIRRLEDAQGVGPASLESEGDTRRRRVMDRMYHSLENGRRELSGRAPLPTPEELRETSEEILDTLATTIPYYRQRGGWRYGEGKEFMDRWQDRLLAQLANLERGENDA
jgi:hypothetical protein